MYNTIEKQRQKENSCHSSIRDIRVNLLFQLDHEWHEETNNTNEKQLQKEIACHSAEVLPQGEG
jgi:hypothetical protein